MATNYYRKDVTVTDAMGNPVSGVQIFVCNQPATTPGLGIAPSPLAQVYLDPAGATPINQISTTGVTPQYPSGFNQRLLTDAYGHCAFYCAPGTYTICYSGSMIGTPTQQMVLPDQQIVVPHGSPQYNSDTSANGSVAPQPDGTTVAFSLSGTPVLRSLTVAINGIFQFAYALSVGIFGQTLVVFESAPHVGDVITARYQVQE